MRGIYVWLAQEEKTSAPNGRSALSLAKLCELHEGLSNEIAELYSEFESYNPAELRFFTMSAVSVFAQSFSELATDETHALIDKFTEQCGVMMLLYMPKAEYS